MLMLTLKYCEKKILFHACKVVLNKLNPKVVMKPTEQSTSNKFLSTNVSRTKASDALFLEKWKASDALPSEPVVYNVAHRVVAHQLIGMDLS